MILVIPLDRAGRDVERDHRRDIEVVARTLIADRRPAVARAPVGEVRLGIVVAGHPHGRAAGLPVIAFRPRLAARLAGRGHGVGAPALLARLEIEAGDEAANAELAARRTDHDDTARHERRQRRVVARRVVRHDCRPHFAAGACVERDEHRFASGEVHLVAVERDAAVGFVRHRHRRRARPPIAPQQVAGLDVDRDDLIVGTRDEHHAAVDDRRGLMHARFGGREHPAGRRRATVAGVICVSGLNPQPS